MSISAEILFTRIRYHNLIRLAHAFMAILWYSVRLSWNHATLWSFYVVHITRDLYGTFDDFNVFIGHSPYMTFYDFPVFCMVVNPGLLNTAILNHTFALDWLSKLK